nr:unnamed protein product [Callosobruchus chinensis]
MPTPPLPLINTHRMYVSDNVALIVPPYVPEF